MNFILSPADAIRVSGWDEHDGQVSPYFRGTERGIKVRVDIAGSQNDAVLRRDTMAARPKLAFMPFESHHRRNPAPRTNY